MDIIFSLYLISSRRDLIYTTYWLQLEKAIYLASVKDSVTVFYACNCQLKILLVIFKKYPVTDLHLIMSAAQSAESVHTMKLSLDLPL